MEANAYYMTGHPTEIITISARSTGPRGTAEVTIPRHMAIQLMEAGRHYQYCKHVGHAMWHAQNPDADSGDQCSSCRSAREEFFKEQSAELRDTLRQALRVLIEYPEQTTEDERKELVERIQSALS